MTSKISNKCKTLSKHTNFYYIHNYTHTNKQKYEHTNKQKYEHTNKQKYEHTNKQKYEHTNI